MSASRSNTLSPRLLRYPRRFKLVAMITLLLFAAALVVAALAAWRQDNLTQSLREDTAWVAYKLDRDAVQLLNHLLTATRGPLSPVAQDNLNLRFELLYSRMTLLREGEVSSLLKNISHAATLLADIQQQLDRLDPMIEPHESRVQLSVIDLETELQALTRLTERFVIAINGYLAESATEERALLRMLYKLLMSLLAGMSFAVLLVIVFLVREMRESAAARREQELLSHQLEVTAQQAQAANHAKSDFLAMVSHEIRTPLNGVIGMSELLRESADPEQIEDYARTIHESGNQLLAMINEILDFSKIEAGHLTLDTAPIALQPLLDSVISLFEPRAIAKGLLLTLQVDAQVPAWVMMDAGRLRQILLNLIANAIKFTDHGEVAISVHATHTCLTFEVTDTGCGLSEQQQGLLFEPFQQADETIARRYGGTGLGLAICKRLIDAMQGRLGVRSATAQGSTFWFELPLVEATPDNTPFPVEPAQDFTGTSLLLVEDNATNRKVAIGLLSRLGCDVVCAENGRDALTLASTQQVHLIFMDVQLPDMDGIQVTQKLRSQGGWLATVPIVAMTAGGVGDDRQRCLAAGMSDYITKPLSLLTLGHVLSLQLRDTGHQDVLPALPMQRVAIGETSLLNRATLCMLVEALGAESINQLIALYHQQISDYFAQLAACLNSSDPLTEAQSQQVARVAHQLRGESLGIGAECLAADAKRLETVARYYASSQRDVDKAVSVMRQTAARTHAALEKWRRDNFPDE